MNRSIQLMLSIELLIAVLVGLMTNSFNIGIIAGVLTGVITLLGLIFIIPYNKTKIINAFIFLIIKQNSWEEEVDLVQTIGRVLTRTIGFVLIYYFGWLIGLVPILASWLYLVKIEET